MAKILTFYGYIVGCNYFLASLLPRIYMAVLGLYSCLTMIYELVALILAL